MLILNPDRVRFDGQAWPGATSVVVDRAAQRLVEERTDQGPHTVLADVAEQRVSIRVALALEATDMTSPLPGDAGLLEWWISPNGSQARRVRVQCEAVVTDVRHDAAPTVHGRSGSGTGGRAQRTVTLLAISSDGKVDPLTVVAADIGPD